MQLQRVHIKGFRNFNDTEISFQRKTLIIGANDVGKTNLIYALRLLFDKTISEHDLELVDSDYNAYSGTNTIEITAYLSNITEDCLLSIFVGAVKDGKLVIRYTNQKGGTYKFFSGYDDSVLTELPSRQYIRRLNMQYVDANRDLFSFLRRERLNMLQIARERLSEEQLIADERKIKEIQDNLNAINQEIGSLNYVSTSLSEVNRELGELSVHNEDQTVRFIAGESDAGKLLDNLVLSYSAGDNPLSIGGDGWNNQIFLATWIAKQHIQESIDHVTFFAIEEPEAHLHPHQQRKLSEYIHCSFDKQILVTTHSPSIASKFDPSSLVRLYSENKFSFAACGGCSDTLKRVISDFGYRLNALSAEAFFADGVLLVEGTSEVLFYSALANELGFDLDRHNISILSVEGIGFKPYVAVCDALSIPWVLRTDNDIFTKPTNAPTTKYYAGISRIIGIIQDCRGHDNELFNYWEAHQKENEWPKDSEIPESAKTLNAAIRKMAIDFGVFVSNIDLETDLANSVLKSTLLEYYGSETIDSLIKSMQTKKAENMLSFLNEKHEHLTLLLNTEISSPLDMLRRTVIARIRPNDNETDR